MGFEIFKQVASIYLKAVIQGPAGATFGPVLGLMVFAYITARLILFATAWAATSTENLAAAPVEPPSRRRSLRACRSRRVREPGMVAAAAAGALGALGLSRFCGDARLLRTKDDAAAARVRFSSAVGPCGASASVTPSIRA